MPLLLYLGPRSPARWPRSARGRVRPDERLAGLRGAGHGLITESSCPAAPNRSKACFRPAVGPVLRPVSAVQQSQAPGRRVRTGRTFTQLGIASLVMLPVVPCPAPACAARTWPGSARRAAWLRRADAGDRRPALRRRSNTAQSVRRPVIAALTGAGLSRADLRHELIGCALVFAAGIARRAPANVPREAEQGTGGSRAHRSLLTISATPHASPLHLTMRGLACLHTPPAAGQRAIFGNDSGDGNGTIGALIGTRDNMMSDSEWGCQGHRCQPPRGGAAGDLPGNNGETRCPANSS